VKNIVYDWCSLIPEVSDASKRVVVVGIGAIDYSIDIQLGGFGIKNN